MLREDGESWRLFGSVSTEASSLDAMVSTMGHTMMSRTIHVCGCHILIWLSRPHFFYYTQDIATYKAEIATNSQAPHWREGDSRQCLVCGSFTISVS